MGRLPEIKKLIAAIKALSREMLSGDTLLWREMLNCVFDSSGSATKLPPTSKTRCSKQASMLRCITFIAVAEAQALYMKLCVLEADALKGLGWFDAITGPI